jgi:RimJ/RimL family protein N-acetyltransferase
VLHELAPERFAELIPLYREAGGMFPIILAVLEGRQRGQAFADAALASAFVVNSFGFCRLLEASPNPADDDALRRLLTEPGPIRPSYLLWYDPPARWRPWLEGRENAVRKRERLRYDFDRGRADYLSEIARLPEGFALKPMDAELLPRTEKFGLALDSRFWPSAEAFLADGLGVAVVRDGAVASLCYAAAVAGGFAEADVVTDEAFRGAGLGTLAAQQFVRDCLARGITPAWDCFTYNQGSMRLAERLGFVPRTTYDFYTFNIPVAPAGGNG